MPLLPLGMRLRFFPRNFIGALRRLKRFVRQDSSPSTAYVTIVKAAETAGQMVHRRLAVD